MMARRPDQSITKSSDLVERCQPVVFSSPFVLSQTTLGRYQELFEEGQMVHRQQGQRRSRLINACWERRLVRLVRSHRRTTVAKIGTKTGYDRKLSENTAHGSLQVTPLYSK